MKPILVAETKRNKGGARTQHETENSRNGIAFERESAHTRSFQMLEKTLYKV